MTVICGMPPPEIRLNIGLCENYVGLYRGYVQVYRGSIRLNRPTYLWSHGFFLFLFFGC